MFEPFKLWRGKRWRAMNNLRTSFPFPPLPERCWSRKHLSLPPGLLIPVVSLEDVIRCRVYICLCVLIYIMAKMPRLSSSLTCQGSSCQNIHMVRMNPPHYMGVCHMSSAGLLYVRLHAVWMYGGDLSRYRFMDRGS